MEKVSNGIHTYYRRHGDAANGNHNWVEIWVGRSSTTERYSNNTIIVWQLTAVEVVVVMDVY